MLETTNKREIEYQRYLKQEQQEHNQMKWGCITIVVGIIVAIVLGFTVSVNAAFICIPVVLLIELMINDS